MNNVIDLVAWAEKLTVGYPCAVQYLNNSAIVYGRVVGEVDASVGFRDIATPGGSVLTTGIAWVKELDEEGKKKLEEFEKLAEDKGQWYGGRLPKEKEV